MNKPVSASDFAQALFAPRAIALVGASGNLQKNTARPMRFMRKHGFQGKLYPINRTQKEIMGGKKTSGVTVAFSSLVSLNFLSINTGKVSEYFDVKSFTSFDIVFL